MPARIPAAARHGRLSARTDDLREQQRNGMRVMREYDLPPRARARMAQMAEDEMRGERLLHWCAWCSLALRWDALGIEAMERWCPDCGRDRWDFDSQRARQWIARAFGV